MRIFFKFCEDNYLIGIPAIFAFELLCYIFVHVLHYDEQGCNIFKLVCRFFYNAPAQQVNQEVRHNEDILRNRNLPAYRKIKMAMTNLKKMKERKKKKYLTLFDRENGKHPVGPIISASKDELIMINKFGGDPFTIWKRL